MSKLISGKRTLIGVSIGSAIIIISVITLLTHHTGQFSPTTLANVQRTTNRPSCAQTKKNTSLHVNQKDNDTIGNTVATSIINVPAGTYVNVYLKSYDGRNATGTAIYPSKYGSYNFTVKKLSSQTMSSYTGGWTVEQFKACKD